MPAKFARPKLSGNVIVRLLQAPQLETSTKITKGELGESLADIAQRVGLKEDPNEENPLSLVDDLGLAIFSKLVDGGIYYITGGISCGEELGSVVETPDICVAWAFDKRVLLHEPQSHRSPETPYRLERAVELLQNSARAVHLLPKELRSQEDTQNQSGSYKPVYIAPRLASIEEITAFHKHSVYADFLESGEALKDLKSDVYCNDQTSSVAVKLSAGAVIDAGRAVLEGVKDLRASHKITDKPLAAFCLVRPPGHHCTADRPSGFCLVNNVAIASQQILNDKISQKQPRIAIIDLDVHFGEGTAQFVDGYKCPESQKFPLLYLSLHRFDEGQFYPFEASGATGYVGEHNRNSICNVAVNTNAHVPQRCEEVISDFLIASTMEKVFIPRLADFKPDLIYLSLGFDAAYGDPLGKMAVEGGFALAVRMLKYWCLYGKIITSETDCSTLTKSNDHVPAGLVVVLEGGYNPEAVAQGVLSVAHSLTFPIRDSSVMSYTEKSVPKTWADIRHRQERKLRDWEASDKSQEKPVLIEENDMLLLERHQRWCESTTNDARATHKMKMLSS